MKSNTKKELRVFLEKNYHIIGDPEGSLREAVGVLEFFKEKTEKEEPHATNTIKIFLDAIDALEIEDLEGDE